MASLHITPPWLYTAATILPSINTIIVGMRFATRRNTGGIGIDDWLVLPALLIIWALAILIIIGTAQGGLGHPSPHIPPDEQLTAAPFEAQVSRRTFLLVTILQALALMFIKLSVLFFYRRIFCTKWSSFISKFIHVFCVLIVIWGISFFFAFLFGCGTHFSYLWTSLENQFKCHVDFTAMDLGLSISDVIMDAIILVFPIPLIMRLQLSARRRIAVIGILSLGALAVSMSAVRLDLIVEGTNAEFLAHTDEAFLSTGGMYFMYLEGCFGLLSVCLPSLSRAAKLKGVQTLIEGFSMVLSNLSHGSLRSRSSRHRNRDGSGSHERTGSSHSQLTPEDPDFAPKLDQDRRIDVETGIELSSMPAEGTTWYTNSVDQSSGRR